MADKKIQDIIIDMSEVNTYFEICRADYPDDFNTLLTIDNGYTYAECYCAIAETAYWYKHGKLPAWASVIERVEPDGNGGYIFVHRDTGRDN